MSEELQWVGIALVYLAFMFVMLLVVGDDRVEGKKRIVAAALFAAAGGLLAVGIFRASQGDLP